MFDYKSQLAAGASGRPPAKPGPSVTFLFEVPTTGVHSSTRSVKIDNSRDDVYLHETTTDDTWKTSHHKAPTGELISGSLFDIVEIRVA
jgi:hypothetical protein